MTFFTHFFANLDTLLNSYFNVAVQNAAGYVSGPISTMAILLIIVIGFMLLRGMIEAPLIAVFTGLITIAFIMVVAGRVGNYNTLLGDNLRGLPGELMTLFGSKAASSSSNTAAAALDSLGTNAVTGIQMLWQSGSYTDIGPYFLAMGVFFAYVIFAVASVIGLMIVKVGLTLTVAIGPIMMLALMFNATRDFFTKWISYALMFAVLGAFIGLVLGLADSLLQNYLAAFARPRPTADFTDIVAPVIVLVILSYIFKQLPEMASSMTGGIGMSVGNAVHGTAGKLTAPAKALVGRTAGEALDARRTSRMRHKTRNAARRYNKSRPVGAQS